MGRFDGVTWPRLSVRGDVGATPGTMVELRTDSTGRNAIRSVTRTLGRSKILDPASPGTCTITLSNRSGDYDPTNGSSPHTRLDIGRAIDVRAEKPISTFAFRFTGRIADIAVDVDPGPDPTVTITCVDGLEALGRVPLSEVPAGTLGSDLTGTRIDTLADLADWSASDRDIDAGNDLLIPTTLGAPALELMRQAEATESGLLFVNETGDLVFYDRRRTTTASRSVNVQQAFSDTASATHLRAGAFRLTRSTDTVYNDIRITRDPDPTQDPSLTGSEPGDVPVEQVATDATSVTAYGSLNLPAQVGQLHRSDAAVLAQAQGLLEWFADATDDISEITVDVLHPRVTTANRWSQLLGLTLLDRISVTRDYGPNTITAELLIQQITEDITADPPGWHLKFTTASPPPAVANTCIRGTGVRGTHKRVW